MRSLVVALVLVALGCAGTGSTAAAPASLSGGAPSSRAAVVAITDTSGEILGGTATLLSPHVAITSADVVAGIAPNDLRVAIGDRIGTTAVLAGVTRVEMDADGELALLGLAFDATAFGGATISTPTGMLGTRGDLATLVGFGATSSGADDEGMRREGTAELSIVAPDAWTLVGPSFACPGDRGAPVLLDEAGEDVIVGVVSGGDCTAATRVVPIAANLMFVETTTAEIERSADAGPGSDAGPRPVDAGRIDAGVPPAPPSGGCSAGSGRTSGGLLVLAALVLGAVRRRSLSLA